MARKRSHAGRVLTLFGLGIALLCVLAALGRTWTPALGLDLEGGTSITLVADPHYPTPKPQQLQEAAGIIDQRVNGSGVAEANVSTQGDRNILVEIPGQNRRDLVSAVNRTAQLRFRLVAMCPQVTGGPCAASPSSGKTQQTPKANGTPAPSTSSSPAAKASAQPSSSAPKSQQSPGAKSSTSSKSSTATKSKPAATAKPKPRPAAQYPAKPRPSPSAKTSSAKTQASTQPSAQPSTSTSATPTAQPKITSGPSAPVSKPLQWMDHPDSKWVAAWMKFKCPPPGKSLPPGADDPNKPLITCDAGGNKYLLSAAIIEGTELKSADFGTPDQSSEWAVFLTFKSEAAKVFGDITSALSKSNKLFAIVLDGRVIQAPGVNEPILDGKAQISGGGMTEQSARSLSTSLKYGALPIKFAQPPTVETIGPSLAGDQLTAGIAAGIVGLLLVMLYCLLYYRGLGLVVIGSLVVAGIITYASVLVLSQVAGFTLTLPGIAGLVVAVGITADSFIVYFERIRDEMRLGKSMRVAVESGWHRARNTCLAADAVSLLAAVVLYIFAIGVVKGFAFALGISTLIDLAVFFWFTKPLVSLLGRVRFFNSGNRFSGLSPETLGIDEVPRRRTAHVGGRA